MNEKKYNQTEAELKEVQQILEEEKKVEREKERLEILKMLTPEQVELIRDLFDTYSQLIDFPDEECFSASCAIADIYGYDPVYYKSGTYGTKYHDRKKYDRALEKMYEDGTASDEIVQKIADKIAKIDEKRNEFKYDNKMYLEEKSKLPHFNGYSEQLEYYSKKELVKKGFKKIVYGLFKELKEATLEADKPNTEIKSAEIADLTIKKEISSSEVSSATELMKGIANKILKYRGEKND